jgi:predicted Co/Zn/Cd cation transporter (cation efflux family)
MGDGYIGVQLNLVSPISNWFNSTFVAMSLLITFIFEFTMKETSKKLTLNSLEKSLDGN